MESSPSSTTPTGGSLRLAPGQLAACIGVGAAAFAIWLWPIPLGLVAIALGIAAIVRGEPRGRWVIVLAVVCVPLGLFIASLPADVVGK
jgi:hypothetical protein